MESAVYCWGFNCAGPSHSCAGFLGDGTTTDRHTPVEVQSLGGTAVAVASGQEFNCAVLTGGTVRCWGYNGNGELGDGSTTSRLLPVTVQGLSAVVAITAGRLHTCALLDDGYRHVASNPGLAALL